MSIECHIIYLFYSDKKENKKHKQMTTHTSNIPSYAPYQRYAALDGVRGIAAFTVVLGHGIGTIYLHGGMNEPTLSTLIFSPLGLLFIGHAAVLMFFILSGFVLSLPFLHSKLTWKEYYPKRILRLYIPTLVSLLLAALLVHLLPSKGGAWPLAATLHTVTNPDALTKQFLLINHELNPPTWSLLYEIIFSLLLPIYLWVGLKIKPKHIPYLVGAIAATSATAFMLHGFSNAVYSLPIFLLGVITAVRYKEITGYIRKTISTKRRFYITVSIATVIALFGNIVYLPYFDNLHVILFLMKFLQVITIYTVFLVILSFDAPFKKFLTSKISQTLGRWSFALYLIHLPVLACCIFVPREWLWLSVSFGVIASIVVAAAFYRLVDLPSYKFLKRLKVE